MGNTQTVPGKNRQTPTFTCKMSGVGCGKKSNGVQPSNIAVAALTIPIILDSGTNSDISTSETINGGTRKKSNKTKKQRKGRHGG